jgi:hypothetical protein
VVEDAKSLVDEIGVPGIPQRKYLPESLAPVNACRTVPVSNCLASTIQNPGAAVQGIYEDTTIRQRR